MPASRNLPDGDRSALRNSERDALFAVLDKGDLRSYVLLRLLYETASRVTELVHLPWSAIDWESRVITVLRLKSGASRKVKIPISKKLVTRLQRYQASLGKIKSLLVFPGNARCQPATKGSKVRGKAAWELCPGAHLIRFEVNRILEHAGVAAGLHPGLRHPHVMKHTRLCDVARHYKDRGAAVQLKELMRWSGHVKTEGLMYYLDDPEDKSKIQKEIQDELESF